jgi:hypothetical protein
VPITVTVSRGNPLPWPAAAFLTALGAALVIAGFLVFPKLEVPGGAGSTGALLDVIAAVLIIPTWIIYGVSLVRRGRARLAAADDVARELPEPPGHDDPAVVAVVVGEGKPSGRAIAATILALADRGAIEIQETGDRVIIDVPATARAGTRTDTFVLEALRREADSKGDVVGPPIFRHKLGWWHEYARDARARAIAAGLLETRIPLVGLMLVAIFTATALAIVFFWHIAAFVGFILLANGLPHLIVRGSGYRLSATGVASRARWLAFGRYIRGQKSLRDVGPAGVTIWGPNLVYGVLVGEGDKAARALSAHVGSDDTLQELPSEFTTEL